MKFFRETWAVIATAVMAWLSSINNYFLDTIIKLLTILIFFIGLTDWAVRRISRKRKKKKAGGEQDADGQEASDGRQVLDAIENTQQPFRTVSVLENPMQPGESIGNFVDKISTVILKGEEKMKKFFKWVWYNKEQLLSIFYQAAILATANILLFTETFDAVSALYLGAALPLWAKLISVVFGIVLTALTVRNVCSKYGLSSLDTIERVLAERAIAATNKLTPEQKKNLKASIATLQATLNKAKEECETSEKALAEIEALFTVDRSLVTNYAQRKNELTVKISQALAVIKNVEAKIAEYKAQLSGKNIEPKA